MKSVPSPKLSIGMPVFNGELYIQEAIDSILSQTFEDFELLISDNASTDRTEDICRTYAAKDTRIHYLRNKVNFGAARNYNHVLELSSGKYFKWAAADDICAPEFFKRCVDILDNRPNVVLCYPKTRIINQAGQIIADFPDKIIHSSSPNERFLGLLYGLHKCTPVFGMIRAEILRRSGLIGGYIASDRVLMMELSLLGEFYEVPDFLFFQREHPKASTRAHHNEFGVRDDNLLIAWYDPEKRHKVIFPWWKLILELFSVVRRANLEVKQKLFLVGHLTRYIIWKRDLLARDLLQAANRMLLRPKSL